MVPADCILIEEMNITVDETLYGNGRQVEKEPSTRSFDSEGDPDNHDKNPDNILLTGTSIMTGGGKAVVCSVGDHTLLARTRKDEDLQLKEQ